MKIQEFVDPHPDKSSAGIRDPSGISSTLAPEEVEFEFRWVIPRGKHSGAVLEEDQENGLPMSKANTFLPDTLWRLAAPSLPVLSPTFSQTQSVPTKRRGQIGTRKKKAHAFETSKQANKSK